MFPSKSTRSLTSSFRWLVAFSVIALLLASILYSSVKIHLGQKTKIERTIVQTAQVPSAHHLLPSYTASVGTVLPLQQNPGSETVATYAADCTTPKTVFELGEEVCAVTTGVVASSPAQRSLTWSDPLSVIVRRTDLDNITQDKFTIPTAQTSQIDGLIIDNRGTWRVNLTPVGRSVVRAAAFFTVQDPANPAVDLNVYNSVDDEDGVIPAGTTITVRTIVTNFGPDAAASVELTEEVPSNAAFVSEQQTAGPSFNCTNPGSGGTGTSSCTINSLAKGEQAEFAFVYDVSAGAPTNTALASLATVTSTTAELNSGDNQWTARAKVTQNENAVVCALGCPANMTVSATTTQGGNLGAIVNFANDIESSGDCGTVSTSPASGSFFPVGTTTVNVTSSTGGGSCSFTVTVADTPAPTITCAADETAQATGSQLEVTVSIDAPTATGNNVQISGSRSDNRPLDDPYPVGTTIITWTAKECNDPPDCSDPFARSASCTQRIIVTSTGAPTISCPSNKTFTAAGCEITLTAAQIGTPTATGSNVTIDSERSDHLALTDPFPSGQTTITWTATDDVGRVASCNQLITVNNGSDHTPPTLSVPPNINTTTSSCSIVLDDELGVATADDDCSASVTITRTGVPAGFVFPTGTTIITYTAKDAAGNTTVGTQTVTVHESPAVPPTITAPGNLSLTTGPGATSCGTLVGDATLGTATASDNCGAVSVARTGVPAGNVFRVGTTIVTYTATDASGNTATATQTVTVTDNTPPIVTAPPAVTLFTGPGATSCSVTVSDLNATLGTGSATDNCAGVGPVIRSGVPAGNVFPLGQTTLTYAATDAHGNSASATQVVTVVDNTPPLISCPTDIIADFNPAVNGAVVTYTAPVGTDNCSATTTQIAGLPSGSTFPAGTTTNTFRVTDGAGLTAECSFKVTVAITSIIGLDSVSLSGTAFVDSYDSTGGYPATKGSLIDVLSNGTITLGGSAKVFGNVRSTRAGVAMSGTTQVTGNATAGTTVTRTGSATVLGVITNNLLAPVMTLPSVPTCGPPYSPNTGISGTYSYNQSTGDLTLTGPNIATLANGSYCFHNVSLSNSSQLKVNGPVNIKMTGTLTTSGATSIPNTTGIPANLRIYSSYSGTNGVTFGNGSTLILLLYAPNTGITSSGAAPLFGTMVGKTITVSNSGAVHYDTRLKTVWPDVWEMILGP